MREFRSTTNIKLGLFVLSILIISGSLLYTNWLVKALRDDNLRFLNYNSKLLANALSADLQSKAYLDEQRQFLSYNVNLYATALSADSPSMDFAFNQIIRNISFPVIITVIESGDQLIYAHRNIAVPADLSEDDLQIFLLETVTAMDIQNDAIPVKYMDREIMRIHFGRVEPREFDAIVENILRAVNFPMILTKKNAQGIDEIQDHTIVLDTSVEPDERPDMLQMALRRMDSKNDPVPVEFGNETVMLIHYEDSGLIQALRWFPFIEFGIMGGFILLGFAGFQFIRKAEHRGIWVGLSKETAHQLGTPLSSLMGWIELLRQEENREQTSQIVEEMDRDLQRLNQVADRFSKIGAGVKLENLSIKELVEPVLGYVQRRIPQWGKTISVEFDCPEDFVVLAHAELFGWAFENLLKNSVDAIKGDEGMIQVQVQQRSNWIQIRVRDNGEGIPLRDHKNIFRPGWSSKKRGWGLGLSLVERIIREYHLGDITVESAPGQGTSFEISLRTSASD
ncbi:MAG: HAMP domain-containing histidine kinase [Candidatus Marinimicrobia bacterium]|jgi:hypothetical protein|nr:HAMP domain-containing histidine kinase [Candidatus Neomarinimicrobiota bacterium]MBT3630615.1 HAMP domain-containing histidine kinase [Candidatus Neomarinimicrobiota bacterium]MBT3825330.1 HAMP domain-containing histidine kinase [Candidatus Neomarinimicrobiota bacterium]MBT4129482.1 HAMP domain-containing histidine kinase [Candidatus Neomarinimicrobiota bacterium]MBT4295765.1 HAMP domain-containing histidine kinase [Candidatus Neomarinimicrobiota bacterium]